MELLHFYRVEYSTNHIGTEELYYVAAPSYETVDTWAKDGLQDYTDHYEWIVEDNINKEDFDNGVDYVEALDDAYADFYENCTYSITEEEQDDNISYEIIG